MFTDSNFKKDVIEKNDLSEDGNETEKETDFENDFIVFLNKNTNINYFSFLYTFSPNTLFFYSENGFCSPTKDILAPPPKV
jgi:hypothetical protein